MIANAKSLRSNQTEADARLWYHLRAHRFLGLKFKRQKPVGRYIADFVCWERRLIIELDGGQHAEQVTYDQQRDAWLRSQGVATLMEPNAPAALNQLARTGVVPILLADDALLHEVDEDTRTRLLAAAYRHHMHWSELIGGDLSMTIPYEWQLQFNGSDVPDRPGATSWITSRMVLKY
jgi:very-short-patch-repair endonuclease